MEIMSRLIGFGGESTAGFAIHVGNFPIGIFTIKHKLSRFFKSFEVFENWFLFHHASDGKNHFLPVMIRIVLNLLMTGFLIGQSWLLVSALEGNSGPMSPPPFILANVWIKLSTSLFFGLQSAIAGELPNIAGKEIFAETAGQFFFSSAVTLTR